MAGVREFFINTFVPLCEKIEENEVNISTLIESSKNWSPIVLDYEDKTKSEKELNAAIILNFCNNYARLQKYPKIGIQMLNTIITNTVDADVIAQQTLLVHITKIKYDVNMSTFLFTQINTMKLIMAEASDERKWKELARKVIQHNQISPNCQLEDIKHFLLVVILDCRGPVPLEYMRHIPVINLQYTPSARTINEIINQSIVDFGLVPASTSIASDVDEGNIKISLVKNVTRILRGFAGFGEIFINAEHFHRKIDGFKGDVELLQVIAKMDIISVALHEYSHLKIRKRTGNFNMSTPILAQLKGMEPSEFGIYNEVCIFNAQVDWFMSAEENLIQLDVNYMERFIKAIENGTMLPTGFIQGALPRVQAPGMGGVDIQLPYYLC